MKVIYVAGPYRAKATWQVVANIQHAAEAARTIWCFGAAALCPHMNSAMFDGLVEDEFFIAGGIEMLKRCDAVYVLPGSENSTGAMREVEAAHKKGIPVFTSFSQIHRFVLGVDAQLATLEALTAKVDKIEEGACGTRKTT